MAQPQRPVPAPRRFLQHKTAFRETDPQLSTQSPQISDREEEKQLVPYAPPGPPAVYNPSCRSPVSDEGPLITETIQMVRHTTVSQTEIVTICQTTNDVTDQPIYENVEIKEKTDRVVARKSTRNRENQPPPVPTNPPRNLNKWRSKKTLKRAKPENLLSQDPELKEMEEKKTISAKAQQIYNDIQRYNLLLDKHGDVLKNHVVQLVCSADNLDKVLKKIKIVGISGGTTGGVGGVAVSVAGLALLPVTAGTSVTLIALGVLMAAGGGISGGAAAIANKMNISQEKKKIKSILQEHKDLMVNIQACLKSINEGMEHLREHDRSTLRAAGMESVRVARVVQLATADGPTVKAIEASIKALEVLQGLTFGRDFYIPKEKDGQKLKKGLESKIPKKIHKVAEELDKRLDELGQIKELFSQISS